MRLNFKKLKKLKQNNYFIVQHVQVYIYFIIKMSNFC